MKKIYAFLLASIASMQLCIPCSDYSDEYGYYNLFAQEIIDAPQYYPFLLTYSVGYYTPDGNVDVGKNENIEEWQQYLGISYDDAYYLVFKASRDDVRKLANGNPIQDKQLGFANASFVKKHKQSLLYLAYAKYLEPYMRITKSSSGWGWYYDTDNTADQLNYVDVINVLTRSWQAEADKELKLRYGYQLVRFAHYNRKYQDAIDYFNKYVEPLNHKPAMYYHALSQKAGVERALGYADEANYNFFRVFTNSKNLKVEAMSSIRFTENVNFERFLKQAKTKNEIADARLLLGYIAFTNPLSEAKKILAESPDAIQAKVLIARAVNIVERECNRSSYYGGVLKDVSDRRYPINSIPTFLDEVLNLSLEMIEQPDAKDKNFWYLTSSYLHFLKKDFEEAKSLLAYVKTPNKKYKIQKDNLSMYIDISEHDKITPELETSFFNKYKDMFKKKVETRWFSSEDRTTLSYNTQNFVIDVLANRYFLQQDYAKSFLLSNDIMELENNPQLELLKDIELFYRKTGKNELEKFILKNAYPQKNDSTKFAETEFDMQGYIDYMQGNIYLAQGNLTKSLESFKKLRSGFIVYRASWYGAVPMQGKENFGGETGYKGFDGVSNRVFGYNQKEHFESVDNLNMATDYLSDFPFIKTTMNKRELVESLIELEKIGKKDNEKGAKANYLIGNFFYNVTQLGFYRHLLRFDLNNGNSEKYRVNTKRDMSDDIYFKYYPTYYDNNVSTPLSYLEKAYSQASNDELKARIAFALSKCEQAAYYKANKFDSPYDLHGRNNDDKILIKDRKYFAELKKYKNTSFYGDVRSNCLYFDYYVKNY